jgi:hypothetical protein
MRISGSDCPLSINEASESPAKILIFIRSSFEAMNNGRQAEDIKPGEPFGSMTFPFALVSGPGLKGI